MVFLFDRLKLVAEPSGAVGVAALLSGQGRRARPLGRRVLSGGNVGAARFAELVSTASASRARLISSSVCSAAATSSSPPGRRPSTHAVSSSSIAAVDDGRRDARVDVLAKLAALDAARDHALDRVDRLRELADPLGDLRAAAELRTTTRTTSGRWSQRAEDDRRDVAELVDGRLVGLLDALDPLEEDAPVLVEDRLEHLVLRVEVVVEEPVRDAGLLGDVADAARVEPLAREHAHGGVEELTPLVLYRCDFRPRRRSLLGLLPVRHRRGLRAARSLTAPAILPSACWNSLGMIQTLFDSPCAICGSICRYW